MLDNNKKFTWENLERMNINELKGITQVNFDPASLIGAEDDEDKLYMQEYNKIGMQHRAVQEKQAKDRKQFEQYGDLKKPKSGLNNSGLLHQPQDRMSSKASHSPQFGTRDLNQQGYHNPSHLGGNDPYSHQQDHLIPISQHRQGYSNHNQPVSAHHSSGHANAPSPGKAVPASAQGIGRPQDYRASPGVSGKLPSIRSSAQNLKGGYRRPGNLSTGSHY